MPQILDELIAGWRQQSYEDLAGAYWRPGDPMVESCPQECDLMDTGWQSVPGADAHLRARRCWEHRFARLYVITGPMAHKNGWTPSNE